MKVSFESLFVLFSSIEINPVDSMSDVYIDMVDVMMELQMDVTTVT